MFEDRRNVSETLREFFRTFKDDKGNRVYWDRIMGMGLHDKTSLRVDFRDLE